MAGIAILASGPVYAADEAKGTAELQAENIRLKKEIEALRQQARAPQAAAAVAASPVVPAVNSTTPIKAGDDGVVAFDKVIVTSRNREEIAQDVPLPVTVLGGERLDREDIKSIYDLPSKVPNLQMNNPGENARKVSPSIRGLGRGGANDSMEQSVGVIVDGVTLYYSGQAWSDYVDLDRIEVMNGPQGTLMGKNTSLGAINIVTKAPSFQKASSFELFTGDLNTLSGKFSSTGPLVDGLLAYRANFVVDRSDGIYTNTYQSMGHAKETWRESNKLAGRFQLLWTPSENLTGRIVFDKLRSDERVNTGNTLISNGPANYANGTARPTVTPYGYAPTGSFGTYGYLGQFAQKSAWFHNADGTVFQPPLNTTDIQNSEARPQITNQYGIAGTFDWRVADHTLTSITAYRYQDFDIKNGGQNGPFYISNSGQQLWNEQFSQELRISSTPAADKKLDYQAGLYYLKARVYSDDPTYYGQDAGAWYAKASTNGGVTLNQYERLIANGAGRTLMQASLNGVYQSRVTDASVDSLAAYGQADWHLTEKATLTFGLRQTQEHKQNRVSQELDRAGENLDTLGAAVGASAQQITDAKAIRTAQVQTPFAFRDGRPIDATLTAWNVGPSYKLNDDVLLYSSLGKGVKSGFIYFDTAQAAAQTTIKPEEAKDIEFGFKSLLLDRKLQLNANAYFTRIDNYQASWRRDDPATPGSTISGWGNVERIGAKGVELQTAYQYNRHLGLDLNAAYNVAKYETSWLIQKPEISTTPASFIDLKGQQVTNVPKVTVNYGFNYQAPIGGFLGRVTLSNSYRSGVYLNDNHAAFTYQKAYNVTNLGLGLGSLNRDWEVSLLARNIFDTEYYTSASTWSDTAAQSVTWGAPKSLMLSFKSKL
jgi:iron complex outermembrane receptor protein